MKPGAKHQPLPASAGQDAVARLDGLRNAKGNLRTAEIRRSMQKIMQNNAAVFRTQVRAEQQLRRALLPLSTACITGDLGLLHCRNHSLSVALLHLQESLEEGCKLIDACVHSFGDVKASASLRVPSSGQFAAPLPKNLS
jgi:hypothetical protein